MVDWLSVDGGRLFSRTFVTVYILWLVNIGWIHLSKSFVQCYDEFEDVFLCRQCGLDITGPEKLKNIPSPYARWQRNATLLGVRHVLIQLMENPSGAKFEIITATKTEAYGVGSWYNEDTWFPEYSWKIAVCPRCGRHLGWLFRLSEANDNNNKSHISKSNFTALILDHLIHQEFADSLIISPKILRT